MNKSNEEAIPVSAPILFWGGGTILVKPGANITLDVFNATDPDSDYLSFLGFRYREVGLYKERIKIHEEQNVPTAYFTQPKVTQKETAHFLLTLTH